MFTGLVESLGRVVDALREPPGLRLVVDAGAVAADAAIGDSICTSGCCLSVVRLDGPRLTFELGPETLARTTLGGLRTGAPVNLERSLRLSDRLGGHLVTGHVDGTGRVQSVDREENPLFRRLIEAFTNRTGVPVLLNSSFNVRGEPIVCTPDEAIRCYLGTDMDRLYLGALRLTKRG